MDFQDINVRTLAERKREEEKQKHLDQIHRESADRAKREMEGKSQTKPLNCPMALMFVS